MCLAAKPAVDGLEREFEGEAEVLRADIQSEAGRDLARRYSIDVVPSFVVVDPKGRTVFRINGARGAPVASLRAALRAAARPDRS